MGISETTTSTELLSGLCLLLQAITAAPMTTKNKMKTPPQIFPTNEIVDWLQSSVSFELQGLAESFIEASKTESTTIHIQAITKTATQAFPLERVDKFDTLDSSLVLSAIIQNITQVFEEIREKKIWFHFLPLAMQIFNQEIFASTIEAMVTIKPQYIRFLDRLKTIGSTR